MSEKIAKKIILGLSGGVDSAVCARLLVERGFDVSTVFLECWNTPGCRTDQDRKDALKIALDLNLPFQVLDFKQAYKDKVLAYFFSEYQAGRTPNPDVMCNKEIKFGLFYDWAMKNGFEYVATGHYAKIVDEQLIIPKDTHKDQTYFLHLLNKEQLRHIIFPLAELTKKEVRAKATQDGLAVADKKDSVGICFVGDINVQDFLKQRLGEKPGAVVDSDGNVVGQHRGLWFYTIGQRSGFTINPTKVIKTSAGKLISKQNVPPFYVIGKKAAENQLVVGFGAETAQQNFAVENLHLIDPQNPLPKNNLFVRIRHTGQLLACRLKKVADDQFEVKLDQVAGGIASGQSAVFYFKQKNLVICLGGGIITTP